MTYTWFVVAFIFMLLELGTPSLFYFLSFCIGALITFGLSGFVTSLSGQMGIFCSSTIIAIIALQMWVKKLKKKPGHKTNFFALEGKKGIVMRDIIPMSPGLVKINGELWSAISVGQVTILQGKNIEIVRVQGAYLLVQEVK